MQSFRVLAAITLLSALACSSQQPKAGKSITVNPDDEIVQLNKQLKTSPNSAELHRQLALMFELKGDWAGFDKEMGTAVQLDPNNPILFIEAAMGDQAHGLKTKAMEMLTRAVAIDPQNPLPHFVLGLTYEHASDSDKAMAEFREAQRLIDTLSLPTSTPGTRSRIIKGTHGETWYRDRYGKDYLLDQIIKPLRKKLAIASPQ